MPLYASVGGILFIIFMLFSPYGMIAIFFNSLFCWFLYDGLTAGSILEVPLSFIPLVICFNYFDKVCELSNRALHGLVHAMSGFTALVMCFEWMGVFFNVIDYYKFFDWLGWFTLRHPVVVAIGFLILVLLVAYGVILSFIDAWKKGQL